MRSILFTTISLLLFTCCKKQHTVVCTALGQTVKIFEISGSKAGSKKQHQGNAPKNGTSVGENGCTLK